MSYILSLLIAAGVGSAKASGQGSEPGFGEAQPEAWPPFTVNFQGHLRQGTTIINGTYQMTFRLYDAASGGTLLQTMGPWDVNVSSGVFNVELPITQANILNYTNLWIEVDIPALGGIYTPRVKINSAAFAYNAFMSDSTQRIRNKGVTPEDLNMLAANPNQAANFDLNANGRIDLALLDVPASGTDPGYIWNQDTVMQNPGRFWIQRQSTVGNPADTSAGGIFARLRPENAGSPYAAFWGQRGTANGLAALAGGWYGGYFLSKTQANNVGVYAWCDAANGQGVFAVGNTGTSIGVWGVGNAAGATGVFGSAGGVATYYTNTGVSGSAAALGVAGYATNAPGGVGVYGTSPGTSGLTIASAVYGVATNASGVGVHGVGNNLAIGWVPPEGAGVVGNGQSYGVYGVAANTGATSLSIGVVGSGKNNGVVQYWGPTGVLGLVPASSRAIAVDGAVVGTGWEGMLGYYQGGAFSPDFNAGVVGIASSSTPDWSGYFYGNVRITGSYPKGPSTGGGNLFVSGVVASIARSGSNAVPLFNVTSSGVKIYFDGQGRLKNGEAFIKIPEDIAKVIAGNAQVVVTPVGSWSGIYVAEIRSDGFLVKSGAGDPNAEFKWIAVAERKGYEDGKALDLITPDVVMEPTLQSKTGRAESSTASSRFGEIRTIKSTDQAPADLKKEVR